MILLYTWGQYLITWFPLFVSYLQIILRSNLVVPVNWSRSSKVTGPASALNILLSNQLRPHLSRRCGWLSQHFSSETIMTIRVILCLWTQIRVIRDIINTMDTCLMDAARKPPYPATWRCPRHFSQWWHSFQNATGVAIGWTASVTLSQLF